MDRKPRLHRLDWVFTRDPVCFVTACTTDPGLVSSNTLVHDSFIQFAQRATERKVFVGRYVIMPDHIHLFVAFVPEAVSLSEWMKSLKNALSKVLRQRGVPSPHWQKGFFDHVLRSSESYSEKWLYVQQNPVRAGLVKAADEWPYQGVIHELEVR